MRDEGHSDTWQMQEAKAKLSAVIDAASKKPQKITVRGKDKAYLISTQTYHRLMRQKRKMNLGQFLDQSPLKGLDLDAKRYPEKPRTTTF